MGNLIREKTGLTSTDYYYNSLNQLVKKTAFLQSYTYSYDKRGNRIKEAGKLLKKCYTYDATNRMVEGTNWNGDVSAYTYNGLGLRINNTVTTSACTGYSRDYVIDYTSPENDDLYVYTAYTVGRGTAGYEQKHVYAGSERIAQTTGLADWDWEPILDLECTPDCDWADLLDWSCTQYVHEDVMGSTYYYTRTNGTVLARLGYDVWGAPQSASDLIDNDWGGFGFTTYTGELYECILGAYDTYLFEPYSDLAYNTVLDFFGTYVLASYTGHPYDPVLDLYFAEARFYDAGNRQWMSVDPIKSGYNWYQYCGSNPATYWDPTGLSWWDDAKAWVGEKYNTAKEWVADKVDWGKAQLGKAKTAVGNFFSDVGSYFEQLACDETSFLYWSMQPQSQMDYAQNVGVQYGSMAAKDPELLKTSILIGLGFVPVVGTVIDIVDLISSIRSGDPGAIILSAVAFLPGGDVAKHGDNIADAARLVNNATEVVTKHGDKLDETVEGIAQVAKNVVPNKGFSDFGKLKKYLGSPGEGKHWHHIVEQSQIGKSGFSAQQIHNTSNIIAVDAATHAKITGYYNTKTFDFTGGLSVRDWLAGQSYEYQYEFGLDVLRKYGAIE